MSGDFDQENMEPESREQGEVVTLGFGKLLALLVILLLVCGLCFGLGYFVGHRGVKSETTTAATPGTDAQPSQPSSAPTKPVVTVPAPSTAQPPAPNASPQKSMPASATAGQKPAQASTKLSQKPALPPSPQPQAATAAPTRASTKQPQKPADTAHTAQASASSYMVQIAAVANPEDADNLVSALRKLKYSVTAQHEADNQVHVRMGPFATRAEADEWRTLLINDGYNAVVQQ